MNNALAEKPRKNEIAENIDGTLVYLPCHGVDGGTGTIAGIEKGNPTKIVLTAGTFDYMVGMSVYISGVGGMSELTDGAYKVTKRDGSNNLWIDVDSTLFSDWTSGGAVKKYYFIDQFNNLAPQAMQGTLTTVFGKKDGVEGDTTTGVYTNRITTGLEAFDLTGFRGRLVIGCSVEETGAAGLEGIFATGRYSAGGAGTKSGNISMHFGTTQVILIYRPSAAADSTAINTAVAPGLVNIAKDYQGFILDFENFPASVDILGVNDGVVVLTTAADMTAATGEGSAGTDLTIGGNFTGAFAVDRRAGTGGTGFKFGDFIWWKTSKSIGDCIKVLNDMSNNFELSETMKA